MSTSYYQMKDSITNFEIKPLQNGEYELSLWLEGKFAGKLIVNPETMFIWNLVDDRSLAPYHGYFGGASKGATLIINKHLPDETKLISEYGEVFTVAEIKSKYQTIEDKSND